MLWHSASRRRAIHILWRLAHEMTTSSYHRHRGTTHAAPREWMALAGPLAVARRRVDVRTRPAVPLSDVTDAILDSVACLTQAEA